MIINKKQEVSIFDLSLGEDIDKKLIDYVHSIGDQQNRQTNVKASMTQWNISSPEVDILKDVILDKFMLTKQWHERKSRDFFYITNIWANSYKRGDYTTWHDHLPAYYSSVYFLKCDKYSAPLVFEGFRNVITPKQGRLILFPSTLLHKVPEQRKSSVRMTISTNILGYGTD